MNSEIPKDQRISEKKKTLLRVGFACGGIAATATATATASSLKTVKQTMLNHFLYRSSSPSLLFSRTFSSTLFVKGISFSSTEETLTQAFSRYGQVLGVNVIMDKVRCRPKGFAYVTFSSKEEAEKALLELNGQLVDGRVVILDTTKARKQIVQDSEPKHAAGGDS